MISTNMREYTYYLYSEENNEYGQSTLITDTNGEPIPQGTIKMSITHTSTQVIDSIKYSDAKFIGLTLAAVSDRYVIQYNNLRLKVLYYIPDGRYKQVFLNEC